MNIILLGPPGAGKGTQAKILSQEFKIAHISTGDMLRDAVKDASQIGNEAKIYMERGELVPDDIVISIVQERITKEDARAGFLLDGFPRTKKQARLLDKALLEMKTKINAVLYFKTSKKIVVDRLSGRRVCEGCGANFHMKNLPPKKALICDYCGGRLIQRSDDMEGTVAKRLRVYEKEAKSLIGHYKKQNLLTELSGDLEANALFDRIKLLFKTSQQNNGSIRG